MVKIAIDISPTLDGNKQRGVGFYTSRLIKALLEEVRTNPKYKNWQIDLVSSFQNQVTKYDLIHYPFFDPFFLTLPPKSGLTTIVTVHDMIPLDFPQHYPAGVKGTLRWYLQRHRLSQVDYIITDSHSSKYQIAKHIKYPLDHIYTIYLAADPIFKPISNQKSLKLVQQKYHLPDKFVLYVGDINWNKNIPNLVKTCENLEIPLVIVGASATQKNVPNHPWTNDLRWLQARPSHKNLILTGYVSDGELVAIYNLATIYCQPSYAEGFGLDPLEALQCGTPVIYSQETSLPEVIADAGLMFNPYKKDHLPEVISYLWDKPSLQKKLSFQGIKRARNFSWSNVAIQTLALYELALMDEKK